MSSVMLIASDLPLREVPYPPNYKVNINVDNGTIDDGGGNDGFAILPVEYPENVPDIPSKKKYFAVLEWHYTPGRAEEVIRYLNERLKTAAEIELWHTWAEYAELGHKLKKTKIPVNKLSAADLHKLEQTEVWKEPATDYCYVVTGAAD